MKVRRRSRLLAITGLVLAASVFIATVLPGLLFPPQPRLTGEQYAQLFPFEPRFLNLADGTRIHYVDEGAGRTLLLLHGNPASAFLYRHLIAKLSADYRVIALDYPGFGKSVARDGYGYTAQEQADTVLDAFDQLHLDDVIIMVQDWGGPIGFNLAQKRSDQIGGLIVGNTWAWPLAGEFRYEAFSWVMGGPIGRGITRSHIGVVHLFLKRGLVKPLPPDAYAGYFQTYLDRDRSPVTTFPRELVAAEAFLNSVEANMCVLSGIDTLIVWGQRDFAFGDDNRRRFEAWFPEHRTVLLPDAGHFIQEDAPDEIAAAIRESFGTRL